MRPVFHHKRYMEDQSVSIAGAAAVDIPNGWYNCFDLMYWLGNSQGQTLLKYTGNNNRFINFNFSTLNFSADAADLMGYNSGSATYSGQKPPGATWAPQEIGFRFNYDPEEEGAEPVYKVSTIISRDGTVFAIGSDAVEEETFFLSMIEREKMTGTSLSTDFTRTWREVWRPDLGIKFLWAYSDTDSGHDLTYADMISGWPFKEYTYRDCEGLQNSRQLQFDNNAKFHRMEMALIYVGTGSPA